MFVEEFSTTRIARIGSHTQAYETRLKANGANATFSLFQPDNANDNALPVAPAGTGIHGSTRVNTPAGPVAIKELITDQTVITSNGTQSRVSFVLPAKTPKTALRIRAPYFGANQDIIIGADHHIEIRSELAEYMFGETSVLVPAWVFKDNSKVLFHELTKSDEMYQLQLEGSDVFSIGKCFVAPLLTGSKSGRKRILDDAEARAFAAERKIGQYN